MKPMLRLVAMFLFLLPVAQLCASPMDEESKEIFARLVKTHADTVVRVSFVMKSSFQGQEQSQETSTTGVVVDRRGLILVPRMVVEPTLPGVDKLTSEQRASFKLETRDFRVRFSGEDTPVEAEALTSDADLGVAWLRIKPAGTSADASKTPASYRALDLAQSALAAPGQAYYVIERLADRFGGEPIVSWGVLVGEVKVPRPGFIATGSMGLGLSAEGKVLGYVVADMESIDASTMMSTQGGMVMTMTPARRLASATERAASLLDSQD